MINSNLIFPYAISFIGLLMLLINGFLFFKHIKGKDVLYRILTIYLVGLGLQEVACNIIGMLKPNSNFYLSHFFFNFQFFLLSIFFYFFFENKIVKRLIVIFFICVTTFILWQYLIYDSELFWQFNIFEVVSISYILIALSLGAIYKMLEIKSPKYYNLTVGIILYFLPSSIIFLSGNFDLIFVKEPILLDIWVFNSIAFILYQYFVYREWKVLTTKT